MSINEKRTMMATMLGETIESDEASVYLDLAKHKILRRLYPFSDNDFLPMEYEITQVELAVRLYARKGAEGESIHNENGINRTYGSVDDDDILKRIVPYAKVM